MRKGHPFLTHLLFTPQAALLLRVRPPTTLTSSPCPLPATFPTPTAAKQDGLRNIRCAEVWVRTHRTQLVFSCLHWDRATNLPKGQKPIQFSDVPRLHSADLLSRRPQWLLQQCLPSVPNLYKSEALPLLFLFDDVREINSHSLFFHLSTNQQVTEAATFHSLGAY